MAQFNYAEMQTVAHELISEFGQSGFVKRLSVPDPVEGGDPVPTAYPANLVPLSYDQRYIDGTNILQGDVQIYISAVGLAIRPLVGDVISCGGVEYQVIGNDPNNYDAATDVVHIVHARA